MAAIWIGLPEWSLTLSFSLSKLRTRSVMRLLVKNGFAHFNPGVLTVPLYWPKSCKTLA